MSAELNFVRQQGFMDASRETCVHQYPALMWQPRVVAILVLIGIILQSWAYFLILSAFIWWSVVFPHLNPFDSLYYVLIAKPKNVPSPDTAPIPRRFAQAMAGTFMLIIGISLLFGWSIMAWTFEVLVLAALSALIFGRFCLGSYLYLVFTGQSEFANKTLPWART